MEPLLLFIGLSIVAFICGVFFFVVDYYNETRKKQFNQRISSLIAGISLSYFFLVVLPEISDNMPEYPFRLNILKYLFVLIGFIFIHVSEKLIFQRVDKKARMRVKQLITMENNLDLVELDISGLIKKHLNEKDLDIYALKDLSRALSDLIEEENILKEQEISLKSKIQNHINKDLDRVHLWTTFAYHVIVGLILIQLFFIDVFAAILFFFFAFFKALISEPSHETIIFSDIPIFNRIAHPKPVLIFFSLATLIGVLTGLILRVTATLSLEVLYILFSFISGVILYVIVRETIPEKEKGNAFYFLLGATVFFILILIINGFLFI